MLITAIRHAESLGNAGLSTETDPRLSPRGEDQARRAAERLLREGVTHVWSSPFRRAIRTASFVARAMGLGVLLEPGMCEHYIYDDLRDWRCTTGDQLRREFDCVTLPEGFDRGPWTPTWGESWDALLARTARVAAKALALGRTAAHGKEIHLVIVGHGASVKALVSGLIGSAIPPDAGFVNAGFSRVRLDGTLPGVPLLLNDASHLNQEEPQ